MTSQNSLQERAINAIRFLSADAVQKANSGHPGLPMGVAAIAYTLWTRHLRFNPKDPNWPDRDRFVLSGGHGSALIYSMLHLTGYDLPLDELMNFRQWGSRTPGHPEYLVTPGVETTTGPLGQGLGNAVGMAMVEAHLAATFNRPGHSVVDHFTYAVVTDGDLMEGVASEAASLAGHLKLGKLIFLYDDNRISIDGKTDLAFTEERGKRFEAYGWHVSYVADGNDVEAIDQALQAAKQDPRPSIILCRTHIGYGLPTRQDTEKAHGEPPGQQELDAAKQNLGWPLEPKFFVPDEVYAHLQEAAQRGQASQATWSKKVAAYRQAHPELAAELERRLANKLPAGWDEDLPVFPADPKGVAIRGASGKVLNALAKKLPEIFGGSADLTPSNKTWLEGYVSFQPETPEGRNVHFGVREHGMGAAVNGMAVHGGVIPFGATFFAFTDYMRPAIRLSALSSYPSIWVFTHDSIGLGEDGPTHQPVEHLAAMRVIPDLVTIRPGDANEVTEAWKVAIRRKNGPTLLALARQNAPTLDRTVYSPASGLEKGAYVLADLGEGEPELILIGTGSELSLVVKAGEMLAAEGVNVRVVSFPSWELFKRQDKAYQDSVLLPQVKARLAVEAGVPMGWERWVGPEGAVLGMETFGASAPEKVVFEKFGFKVETVIEKARYLLREGAAQ